MPSKPCQCCHKWAPIFANRMCRPCFAEWGAANGVPAEQMPQLCPVEGCADYVEKRGLCDRHYRRFMDHGTTEKLKVVSRERRHREYKNWLWLKTSGKLCDEWLNFWTFVEAIGERPTERHWLERVDASRLYGPDNWEWRAPRLTQEHSSSTREGRAAYQKAVRELTPRYWVGGNLKSDYGLTREQYDTILAAQGGGCAICGRTEDTDRNGNPQLLAVDHDHGTNEVRGLLCRQHNMMLGQSGDSPAALRKGADYLERPRHTGFFVPQPGDENAGRRRGMARTVNGGLCSEDGCEHPIKARGLCAMHYARFQRTGTPGGKQSLRRSCSAEGCGRLAVARGFCQKHYYRAYNRGGLENVGSAGRPIARCTVDGCTTPVVARGLCDTHYARWKRHGSPEIVHDTKGRVLTCDTPSVN